MGNSTAYLFRVRRDATVFFEREIIIAAGRSFRRDVTDAYAAFRKECPGVNLYDEGDVSSSGQVLTSVGAKASLLQARRAFGLDTEGAR